MEKKKLLLVAVSVGVFLIIVMGLSILIFLPKNREPSVNSRVVSRITTPELPPNIAQHENAVNPELDRTEPATMDAMEMIRNREDFQSLQNPPPQNKGSDLVIEVQRPQSVAVPSTTSVNNSTGLNVVTSEPVRAAVPSQSRVVSQPEGRGELTGTTQNRPQTQQQTRTSENYWVQAGSFSSQVRAEDVRENLASKGITAIIENRDINGQNFFRVRIGPYTSQNEADYWLAIVKTIDGFEGSQIWQSRSQR